MQIEAVGAGLASGDAGLAGWRVNREDKISPLKTLTEGIEGTEGTS